MSTRNNSLQENICNNFFLIIITEEWCILSIGRHLSVLILSTDWRVVFCLLITISLIKSAVNELIWGFTATSSIVFRAIKKVAFAIALVSYVTSHVCCNFIVLQQKALCCWFASRIDSHSTSVLSSFYIFRCASIIENGVVEDIDVTVLICCLLHTQAIDTVVEGNVVLKVEGAFIVYVARNINALSINNNTLIPVSVIFYITAKLIEILSKEERHEVSICIYDITSHGVGSASFRFSKDNCATSRDGPPGITINQIVRNNDIITFGAVDSATCTVMDFVRSDCQIVWLLDRDATSTIIRQALTNAIFVYICPPTLTSIWAGIFGFNSTATFVSACCSNTVVTCFNSSDFKSRARNL